MTANLRLTRRQLLSACVPLAVLGATGCHSWPWHKQEVECTEPTGPVIQRRFFVEERRAFNPLNETHPFVTELIAAINLRPACQTFFVPWEQTMLVAAGGAWQVPACPGVPPEPPQLPTVDQYLLVQVTEVVPYRPMRMSAIIEQRSAALNYAPVIRHRTWEAMVDDKPLTPRHFDTKLFEKPEPVFIIEDRDLSRLSPRIFFRFVARQLALELATAPMV